MERKSITPEDVLRKINKSKGVKGLAEMREQNIVIKCDEPSYKKLQKISEDTKACPIKGVEGIQRAVIRRVSGHYVIYTEGSNLEKVLEIQYVDKKRTSTNSIMEIYEALGIEAARNAIINEATRTLDEQGLTVDIRHIMLVADLMSNDGDVKAIGRHGISGRKSSVLARAAFEITSTHLLRAGITGEVDTLEGVVENIIVGQPVTVGTGAVNLVWAPSGKGEGDKK
jgi:DNA-directed RNA polymerase subunit A"